MPERTVVRLQSSWLRQATYDPETKQLDLITAGGQTYTYEQVPEDTFIGLAYDPSPGKYFNTYIKDRY